MKFYTSVTRHKNDILYRGVENGKRTFRREKFQPTLFVKNPKGDGNLLTLENDKVTPVDFRTMGDASRYIKNNQTEDGYVQGTTNYISQFLYNAFPEPEIEYNLDQLCTATVDIETTCEDAFPNVDNPVEQITVITSYDTVNKVYHIFTHKEVRNVDPDTQYDFDLTDPAQRVTEETKNLKIKHHWAQTEQEMLLAFIRYWKSIYPDMVTGWNNNLFDMPYLISRIGRILSDEEALAISPWNIVERREVEVFNKIATKYLIYGVAIMDYLELYKKFTQGNRSSYKLDFIAELELGKKKISYDEHGAMHLFYKKDFRKFVEYNVQDVVLVVELEQKMRLIELAVYVAYWSRVNFDGIFSPVRMIESICFNHMMNKGIVFPPKHNRKKTRQNKGAYVKEPTPSRYEWVVSFDVTSLYPSIIMQQNISPECLIEDGYVDITVDDLLERKFNEAILQRNNATICGNGWTFNNEKQGILPEVIAKLFAAREQSKKLMLEADRALQERGLSAKEKKRLQSIKDIYDIRQNALKILLNSFYGAFANEGFIFFDMRMAEAVTYTGQLAIRWGQNTVNDYLNKVLKTTEPKDFVIAIDTDSLYITLDDLVKAVIPDEKDPHKIVAFLDKACQQKIAPLIDKSYQKLADSLNSSKKCIKMKREVIASRGIWTGKKHYALNVYDKEGTLYKEPELKLVGLETNKSSTPQVCRDALTEAISITMNSDEESLIEFVSNFKKEYYEMGLEKIAMPRGVSNIDKFDLGDGMTDKGCPIHVSAAISHNHLIKQLNLNTVYSTINSGDKIKFLHLKKPNPTKRHVIGFKDTFPKHFELEEYIDKDAMFAKTFVDPLEAIVKPAGWSIKPKPQNLLGCFG